MWKVVKVIDLYPRHSQARADMSPTYPRHGDWSGAVSQAKLSKSQQLATELFVETKVKTSLIYYNITTSIPRPVRKVEIGMDSGKY